MELFYSTRIEGEKIYLEGDEASHCSKVLRHKVGDEIFVFDSKGRLFRCNIENISKSQIELSNKEQLRGIGRPYYKLTMAVCPPKNIDRFEWFVEKATELGVERIIPIISDHSIRKSVKIERLRAIALAATKQSLKTHLPKVEECMKFKDFISEYAKDFDLRLIAHCEKDKKYSIREILDRTVSGKNIGILIGPEGDFSAEEIALAKEAGFFPITLGKSRLRVETAALVSVSEIYFYFANFAQHEFDV